MEPRGMKMGCIGFLTALVMTAASVNSLGDPGESDEIVTDRPDVAESSETVGKLRLQVEVGGDFETDRSGDTRVNTITSPTKIRFGIVDPWELHLESDFFNRSITRRGGHTDSETGVSDLDVGTKVHFFDQKRAMPSTGVLAAITIPLGSEHATGNAYVVHPTLATDWALTDEWGIGLNLGVSIPVTDREDNPRTLRYALAAGRTWSPLLDSLRAYLEFFGETSLADGETVLYVDGGFSYLVAPRLQLDIAVRAGLNDAAADFGAGAGMSFKI